MIKIEHEGITSNGNLYLDDKGALKESLKSFPDCRVKLTVEKWTGKKTKKQRGYYFAVIVPHTLIILRDKCGYVEWQNMTAEDAHEFLKLYFNPVYVPDPETAEQKPMPGSTRKMGKDEKRDYIDRIVLWAWDKFSYTFPPPKRGEDKYYFSN